MQKIHHLRAASRVAPRTAGLAAALVLLAACASGSGSGATGQVASIPSSGGTAGSVGQSSAAAVSSHPNLEGPALSEEATTAQIKTIEGPWVRCLGAHGTALALTPKLPGLPMPISTISAAARNACRSLQPHPPWQEIPADNPNYKLDMAKWINCMNARGVGVEATSAGPTAGGWTFTRSDEPANANQIEGQCEAKAFGA